MSEFRDKVAEKYKDLFKGYSFNFEGLKERTKEGFVKLVKEMGAKVSDDAEFTFVEQSYFQMKVNNTRDNYYDINYIIEAVENIDPSNLLNYKLFLNQNCQVPNDEPMCYAARYIFKTDSCHKSYYEKIFCKECVKSNEEPQEEINQCLKAIAIHSNATDVSSKNEDEIPKTPKKKDKKNQSESSKRLISSELEDYFTDEEQSKFLNNKTKSPPRKKLKNSSDADETLYECTSSETIGENNDSRSDINSLNNSGKVKNGESTNNRFKEINSPRKQRAVTRDSDASNTEEDDDTNDSSFNENKKQPQKLYKKRSEWIIPAKTKVPPSLKEQPVESSDEESHGKITVDDEAQVYFRSKLWWLPHDIPEKEQCTYPNCSYEPEAHPTHYRPRKFLSLVEKKIIVKYLINNNVISLAKGKNVYENMIRDGYLSHRSWETLRNCVRRTILKEIKSYRLDKGHLNTFLSLKDKKLDMVKIEKR